MLTRIMQADDGGRITIVGEVTRPEGDGWQWIDIRADAHEIDEVLALTSDLGLDPVAVSDAVGDHDLPKVDDFGDHLLIVVHGLSEHAVETYEIDCFLAAAHLVTIHTRPSPAVDALWASVVENERIARGGTDELMARLADVATRRLLSVLDEFDDQVEELVRRALAAEASTLHDLMAVRGDLAALRRVINPQREALFQLRGSGSPLLSDRGRRRFSDAFDVAARASQGLESSRIALAEILDAYRGAEARNATDVTKVLTIYAAIMLPLTLVVGFFGMNFDDLPGQHNRWGWLIVTAVMVAVATTSLGVFVVLGWMRRPSGREAGAALGRGLVEAARAPVHVVGAVYEISTMPLRVRGGDSRRGNAADDPT